jgi:hypothetical protein
VNYACRLAAKQPKPPNLSIFTLNTITALYFETSRRAEARERAESRGVRMHRAGGRGLFLGQRPRSQPLHMRIRPTTIQVPPAYFSEKLRKNSPTNTVKQVLKSPSVRAAITQCQALIWLARNTPRVPPGKICRIAPCPQGGPDLVPF